MRALLGGKGANLAEMASLGLPVPPGFTITTEVCTAYNANGRVLPADLKGEVEAALAEVGRIVGGALRRCRRSRCWCSVRSGARASMPGMLDTILNLGLNAATVEGLAAKSGNPRFAYDSYRRFIQMYSDVVLGVDHGVFEDDPRRATRASTATRWIPTSAPRTGRRSSRRTWRPFEEQTGKPFPQDTGEQLWGAIAAVFGSWDNDRAKTYRRLQRHPRQLGHRRQRAGHGVRQPGTNVGHRRRLHPQPLHRGARDLRRVPDQRAGRGRGGGHPHAAAVDRGSPQGGGR